MRTSLQYRISQPQREVHRHTRRAAGLRRLRVLTADVNDLQMDRRFDRVISVEMFEHVRNPEALMARIASSMKPDAKFFMHIFCHKTVSLFLRGSRRDRLDRAALL